MILLPGKPPSKGPVNYTRVVKADVGIIGGTGIGERLATLGGVAVHVPTAFGISQGRMLDYHGLSIFLMSRHSSGHTVPPHRVNYAAMASALRTLGASCCLATAAVGSLDDTAGPGTIFVCSDFLDVTGRQTTLFANAVQHTDFSYPMGVTSREALLAAADSEDIHVRDGGVYVCVNGPRYETPHEISTYRQWGGSVVGMTAASEAICMQEAGIDYACLSIVTNFASGISTSPLSHQEVVEQMDRSGDAAVRVLLTAATRLNQALTHR